MTPSGVETTAAAREQARLEREYERSVAAYQRALVAAEKADARAQANAQKEATRRYQESMVAKAESMTQDVATRLEEIDAILAATLDVDDHMDLDALRLTVEHPQFTSTHGQPIPPPDPMVVPPEPQYLAPPEPTGMFGKKKRYAEAVEAATADYYDRYAMWQAQVAAIPGAQFEQMKHHAEREQARLAAYAADQAAYDAQCAAREREVDQRNAEIDELVRGRAAGERDAIEQYVGLVFANSVYPDGIEPGYTVTYDEDSSELQIDMELPRPDQVPSVKAYKYVKASDEITSTQRTVKEQRDRYAGLVRNMVLRTLHEVFEADRDRGAITSISLTAGVRAIDPATGVEQVTPIAAAAVASEAFNGIELANIDPVETLKFLGAAVSKNPHALVPIASPTGVQVTPDGGK